MFAVKLGEEMRVPSVVAIVLMAATVSACGNQHTNAKVEHCGSFKYGLDGQQSGPGEVSAMRTTCWMARAIAILYPALPAGWTCKNPVGIRYVCAHGDEKVTFYGE